MEHRATTRAIVARYLRRRWRRPAQAVAAVVIALLMIGFGPFRIRASDEREAGPGEVRVRGEVESLDSKGVGSLFDGRLLALDVRDGARVHRGQVLFRMDTSSLESARAAARAAQSSAAASLAQTRSERRADMGG